MRFGVILPVAAIVLAACETTVPAQPLDMAKFDALQPGVTTKAEAEQILGAPTSRMPSLNNHSTLMYNFTGPSSTLIIAVLFDPQDKFVRYRAYEDTGR